MLDNYVKTAISIVRVLKRVPKDSRDPLVESLSDKINDIVYNVEDATKWLIFFMSFLFFLEQTKRSGRKQTTSMSSLINIKIRANDCHMQNPSPSFKPALCVGVKSVNKATMGNDLVLD